jgi:DoxX-like protein
MALAFVWLASAVVGFVTPPAEIREILGDAGVVNGAIELDYFAATVDALLGLLLLFGWRLQLVGALMLVSLLAYTVFVGVEIPALWLEPLGGLLKNLVLIPAVLLMMATADRR